MKILTLGVVHQGEKVLLGMKKRGFGQGKWNGFGGKVQEDESIEVAARREINEEAGIRVDNLEKIGILQFEFSAQGGPALGGEFQDILEVHIFKARDFTGQPVETQEMKPQWFKIDELPFNDMWPDDRYWFPLFLAGKKFKGKFVFDSSNAILEYTLFEVGTL